MADLGKNNRWLLLIIYKELQKTQNCVNNVNKKFRKQIMSKYVENDHNN